MKNKIRIQFCSIFFICLIFSIIGCDSSNIIEKDNLTENCYRCDTWFDANKLTIKVMYPPSTNFWKYSIEITPNNDFSAFIQKNYKGNISSGKILLISGKALLIKGLKVEKGKEIDVLDIAVCN